MQTGVLLLALHGDAPPVLDRRSLGVEPHPQVTRVVVAGIRVGRHEGSMHQGSLGLRFMANALFMPMVSRHVDDRGTCPRLEVASLGTRP
jgi:hypothetical protein